MQRIIDLIDNDNNLIGCCINCKHFALWENDWCCTSNMLIIQYGENFTEDILDNIKTAQSCTDFEISNMPWVEDYEHQFKLDLKYGTF